jgi:hypothetical protein
MAVKGSMSKILKGEAEPRFMRNSLNLVVDTATFQSHSLRIKNPAAGSKQQKTQQRIEPSRVQEEDKHG